MRVSILFLDSFEITGPKSAPGSCPALTFNDFALATRSGIQFLASPTIIATLSAIHLCPAAPNAAPANWSIVASLFASGRTIA